MNAAETTARRFIKTKPSDRIAFAANMDNIRAMMDDDGFKNNDIIFRVWAKINDTFARDLFSLAVRDRNVYYLIWLNQSKIVEYLISNIFVNSGVKVPYDFLDAANLVNSRLVRVVSSHPYLFDYFLKEIDRRTAIDDRTRERSMFTSKLPYLATFALSTRDRDKIKECAYKMMESGDESTGRYMKHVFGFIFEDIATKPENFKDKYIKEGTLNAFAQSYEDIDFRFADTDFNDAFYKDLDEEAARIANANTAKFH